MTKNGHSACVGGYEALPIDMLCGIGPCKPQFLQMYRRVGAFVGIYSFSALVTSVLVMYIVSQITTIEKQYGLSSSQSGFLLSCNDLGFLLTTLFASYIARKVHIPRVLCGTVMLYGLAALLCAIPYFISRDLSLVQVDNLIDMLSSRKSLPDNVTSVVQTNTRQSSLCLPVDKPGTGYSIPSQNGSRCDVDGAETSFGVGEPNQYTNMAMAIIAIGMVFQGIAKSPRNSFLTTYIDDNVNRKNTAMYMGIVSGVGILGPALAFGVGGLFSRFYVTLDDVPISPRHPAWIGAWWLGFVVFGLVSMVIGLPLLCFPRRIRQKTHVQEKLGILTTAEKTPFGFVKAMCRLLSNMVLVPLIVSICCTLFGIAGLTSFTAKYIETQFYMPSWKANMVFGIVIVFAGFLGTIGGGCIVTKKKLSPLQCSKMLVVTATIATLGTSALHLFGCPNAEIAGYNLNSTSACLSDCGCDSNTYFPVCGSDNINHMSPCHAGCTEQINMTFASCSCIGGKSTATPGLCEVSCPMLIPFTVILIISMVSGTLAMMPSVIVTIRSVEEKDKPLAVGFSAMMTTFFGWFLGPIVFGNVIDTTCSIWSTSCSGQGACSLYDNADFRLKFVSLMSVSRVCTLVLQIIVYLKARKKTNWSVDELEQRGDNQETTVAMLDQDGGEQVAESIYKPSNKNKV